jgi:tetrahydromethanopterin S-methyltransferase subunit C
VKPWLAYSLLRVGVFAVAFAALMLANVPWWLSAIIAAVIGLCVGYIFFGRLRNAVAVDIADRRARPAGDADSTAEDQ